MKVSRETIIGCGVDGHDEECLCDVVIVTPTPIGVRDAVNDMWCGREICDIRGHGVPWTNDNMIAYFTDLVRGHDGWIASNIPQKIQAVSEYEPVSNAIVGWKQIRESVRQALNFDDPKPTVESVLTSLGFTAEQFLTAATTGRFTMNMETLNRFETCVLEGVTSLAGLARQFGTSVEIAGNLFKYWNVPFSPLHKDMKGTKIPRERMRQLILQGLMPNDISKILLSEYGYHISRHSVSKAKGKLLKQVRGQDNDNL